MNTAAVKIVYLDAITAEEEAHALNVDFARCHALSVQHGHPAEDEARADQFELVRFADMISKINPEKTTTIKFPKLTTEEGRKLGQIVDQLLRNVVDVIHEETEVF
jgi:hypothetical protein